MTISCLKHGSATNEPGKHAKNLTIKKQSLQQHNEKPTNHKLGMSYQFTIKATITSILFANSYTYTNT